ncbi:acetyl/propionyl/methylcrotonyl-CoA carboxylase subunit alpha [Janthinobacterium sp. PC23-8]|uniref:acetyl-CoA carboxylase biotin carboxylase subunit n=1 Tax=Janthinobacterium sp. PC23-8 TaxID=2012679 RepID=UPI0020CC3F7D|nr:biotin carboxylase N-terminal domain-containing protein [Janthinobacterium sp. PC23-8]
MKLIVANRGEIACRVLRAAKCLGLPTVAVYSEADEGAPHVAMADEAVLIGPAPAGQSYLDQDKIMDAARRTGATMLHPGYGFLAENAGFARRCADEGVRFVGPSPDVITAMGDKEQARRIAIEAGVPVSPGTGKLGLDAAVAMAEARRVGFPLLVKAAAGGGGIGMRLVGDEAALAAAVETTRSLAERAFGDGSVYLEHFVQRARHIEVQVFGFGDGKAVHLFDRDCSVQRRHQKVIEEASSPSLTDAIRTQMTAVAVRLAAACRYEGAGTVEFMYDEQSGRFFFLEMNTRIQVEHPVTELVTGVDLVVAQLRQALGEDLSRELAQERIGIHGHAVEARIYAERPAKNFMPSPGPLNVMRLPSGDGLRIDTGFREGMKVTPFYDPMLMKVIAHGGDRKQAIARLHAALGDVLIEGIETNVAFLRNILAHPTFVAGQVHTTWLNDAIKELV